MSVRHARQKHNGVVNIQHDVAYCRAYHVVGCLSRRTVIRERTTAQLCPSWCPSIVGVSVNWPLPLRHRTTSETAPMRFAGNWLSAAQHGVTWLWSVGRLEPMDAKTTSLTALPLTSYRLAATHCGRRCSEPFIVATFRRYSSISLFCWQPIAAATSLSVVFFSVNLSLCAFFLAAICDETIGYFSEFYYSPGFDVLPQSDFVSISFFLNLFRRLFKHPVSHSSSRPTFRIGLTLPLSVCVLSLYHNNCYSTTIRLRFDDIPRRIRLRRKWSKLRFAFDSTVIRLRHDYDEKLTCSFFARVESRRMEAGRAIRRSRIVVVS